MARIFEFLRPNFVAWDTAPGAGALPYAITWPTDFPADYQDPDYALLIQGVTVVGTPALVTGRRVILACRGPGPGFVEWLTIPSTGTLAALGATRRFEFQAGQQVGTVGTLFKEHLPANLLLLPGHRLVIDFENRQTGDTLGFASLRGSLLVSRG